MKKNNYSIKKIIPYLIILCATIFVCIPLFNSKLNMYRDDGIQHICRLMGTQQSIEEGQVFPLIMSNFCNGFGYSWNIFYSPVTAYGPLLLRLFQFSFTNCIKLFMGISVLISGIAMYKFVKNVTGNTNISILAATFYIMSPYRMTDMYIRNAFAELVSFMFLPIIFNGLFAIINKEKNSYWLAVGTIGLILTHMVITLYMAIICAIYVIVHWKKLKNKNVIANLLKNILLIVLITSFYWIPLLQHKITTSYEVFVPGRMQRLEVLEYYKLKFYQLFYTKPDKTHIVSIGLSITLGLLLTPIAYTKIPKDYKRIYTTFLVTGLLLIIMTLDIFPFEKLPNILTMIQFTFRLLEFTSFLFAIVSAINFGVLIKKFSLADVIILTIITGALLVPYTERLMFKTRDENTLWPAVNLTQNTGRVHAGMASFEYLPSKAFNNKQYIINRNNQPIVTNGNAKISDFNKNGTNMTCTIYNITEDTTIELPYIYYLGYNIYTNNDNNKKLVYNESDNGFIEITIPKTDKNVQISVKYNGTTAMKISALISIVSTILLIILVIINKKNRKVNY